MYSNIDKFPKSEQGQIRILKNASYGIIILFGLLLVFSLNYGPIFKGTAAVEWGIAIYFLNFYTVAALVNPFYDSVSQPTTVSQ